VLGSPRGLAGRPDAAAPGSNARPVSIEWRRRTGQQPGARRRGAGGPACSRAGLFACNGRKHRPAARARRNTRQRDVRWPGQ